MKEVELKPCKCGGKAVRVKIYERNRYDCFFRCDKCGYETKVYVSAQGAKKAWNRRADNEQREAD